jgi:predicted transcriptional regulator of viral defense system
MAAVLAAGEEAVLSHRSAAALWQLLPARGRIHIATPRKRHNRDGIDFHSQSLQFDEITTHDGIPTTTVARTLLDIAATEPDQLERAFNEAEFRRLWDVTGVAELIGRYPRRSGTPALAKLRDAGAKGITREELDSRSAHDTTSRFDSDRERDRLVALAGWRVIRLTWKHLTADAERVAADLHALIA